MTMRNLVYILRRKSRVIGRERATEENRDESDECEQSEDETFRNVNKFVEIEYENGA